MIGAGPIDVHLVYSRGSTTVYALYRHTLPFQVWKSIMTYRARIVIRYLYV